MVKLLGNSDDDSYSSFVGENSAEVLKTVKLHCLYTKNDMDYDDSHVGFNQITDVFIYLSSKEVITKFGKYVLDPKDLQVEFEGKTYNVLKYVLLEELFDKPVGIELHLKDTLRG